jgi:hypothetical protein
MNRAALKTYAPQARKDFIQAIADRAAFYGITAEKTEPIKIRGDVVVILGREHSKAVASKRMLLEERIKQISFAQTLEAIAYSWFNRFVALRYMELHGYLDHGYRVLSHPEGKNFPENLEHAEHLDLPNLDKNTVIDLKLAGNKENELYRMILLAQCNALHSAMPFLFERIDDETELLLPENLLNSDSLIRKLVNGIEESDWDKVEILGWLYQYYISDKKDEVIGSVVASEDIPAATQLFTPNWIVKYLVQNTLGRQWLATYPDSALRTQMEYYIEPAEQEPEVVTQLKEITPTSLNPEEITFLDPACGSGHILVEAYDLFKAIYQERGYRSKDIPALILQKNLHGFEIDDRASQLAMFALTMKAREDDRNLFKSQKGESGIQPNILCFVESKDLNPESITAELNANISGIGKGDIPESDITELVALFEHAKTFGSLIQIPEELVSKLPEIEERLRKVEGSGDLSWMGLKRLVSLIQQAKMLSQKYDAVVANPPYMGSKFYTQSLKVFINKEYKESKADLYACFMERNRLTTKYAGFHGMINIPNWMFLSSFVELRKDLLSSQSIDTFIHNGRGVFGSDFGSCAFVIRKVKLPEYRGTYRRLFEKQGSVASNEELEGRFHTAKIYTPRNADFFRIPGNPIAYWASKRMRECFKDGTTLGELAEPRVGLQTGDNNRFLRSWYEVGFQKVGLGYVSREIAKDSRMKWFPYNKGGEYRRWYGNNQFLVNWESDGIEIRNFTDDTGYLRSRPQGLDFIFRPALTWSFISSSFFAVRCSDTGFLFDVAGSSAFPPDEWRKCIAGFLCSSIAFDMMKVMNPTMNFQVGNVAALPILKEKVLGQKQTIDVVVQQAVQIACTDWDSFETSWDFKNLPVLQQQSQTLAKSQEAANAECIARFAEMKQLEEENNRIFINAYGLQDEISPDVSDDQITLHRPEREQDIKRLISYAIGCMMGRYSLDKVGLIYANSGNEDFDPTQYKIFPADEDGIIPLLNADWGIKDDATERLVQFIATAWDKKNLEENLAFIAESLGASPDALPRDVIRKYLSSDFYKSHLQVYKRRPIYWLFSSGKLKAFQCLVYLHRYNEGTLSRMRTEYVIPLLGRLSARIEQLEADKLKSSSTSQRKKLQKEQDDLRKQHTELMAFDEKLKNYADQKIKLDLDDGVKVNYAKFADILAEVKAVTGGSEE